MESPHKEKVKTKTGVLKPSCNRVWKGPTCGKSLPKKLLFPLFYALAFAGLVFSESFFGRRGGGTLRSAVSVWDSFPVSLPWISALAGSISRAS